MSVTVAASATVWLVPASAVGASLAPAVTVIVTVSAVEVFTPSETVRENTSEALDSSSVGAVKVGLCAVEELRDTVVPEVWLQA